MKFRNTKLSRRTLALLAAAVILFGGSGITGTRAALNAISGNYDATIATDTLGVEITENGNIVSDGVLYSSIGDKVEPTRTYEDAVGVLNNGTADEYVRVIVRKYWTDAEGNKTTELDPALIELSADESLWTVKDGESEETQIYYLKSPLAAGDSKTLFEDIRISGDVLKDGIGKTVEGVENGKATTTIITYTYDYDGYTFNVEAEAQSVQTHHYRDAMKSVWGVNASDVL